MGKNSHKFNKRGGKSSRGHNFRDFKGKNFPKSKHHNEWPRKGPDSSGSRPDRPEQVEKITLKEDQVGITEFVSTGKGFTGVVKARFSDFHVNEIDLNGTILQLNDLTIPTQPETSQSLTTEELASAKNEVADVVTEDMWKEIVAIDKGERSEPYEIDVTALDKEKRTTIHTVIKQLYGKVNSSTLSKNGEGKFIRVIKSNKEQNRRNRWPYPGEYVHFLIYKENMDTSEVAVILANFNRLPPSQVNYCGTKDKRGKTTQKFCIRNRHPHQIARAVKNMHSVKIGDFTFHNKVIKLGDLKGNRFRVALRHVGGDRAEIEKSLESIREYGFINYYGLQRFGNNASVPTYEVGKALLKSDYKTACELILKPRDNDIPFMRNIREKWWKDRDSAAAAAMFHNDRFIEKKLLDGLSQYGENDYANSLRKIPRNMLLLYTHAFQSLIFNRVASKRIKEHGLKLIVGDLVYRNQDELDVIAIDTENALSEPASSEQSESAYKQKVKSLTEEDISSGKHTIFDIVLPLPGHDITYPANEIAQWYEDILAEDGLNSEKLKHGVKTFSLAGAYRKLLIKPENMTWYFQRYNSPEEDVIKSHFEKSTEKKDHSDEGEGKFTALVLDFCLPASVYATMFLREILKSDTSATNQANIGRAEMKKFEDENRSEAANSEVETDILTEKSSDKRTNEETDESEGKKSEGKIDDSDKQSSEETDEPEAKRVKKDSE